MLEQKRTAPGGPGGRSALPFRVLVAIAAALAALALAACGGDSGGGSDEPVGDGGTTANNNPGVEEARELVAVAEQPIEWQPPGEPFDATAASGKSIWYISYNLAIPFEQRMLDGMKAGAEAVGASATGFDGKSDVSEYSRGLEQAIRANADVIILGGIEPKLVEPALAEAERQGIPVIAGTSQDPGPPLDDYPAAIVAVATHSYSEPGRMMAQFIVSDSDGEAEIIFLKSSDLGMISQLAEEGFTEELERLCDNCSFEVIDVPGAQWSQLSTKAASMVRSNPDVNYLVPFLDGMVPLALPGLASAGAKGKVRVVSFNASQAVMKEIENGAVAADVGNPNTLEGWAFADQALRLLSDQPPVEDIGIPFRLFTENNVGELDLNGDESAWYGDIDFITEYKKLWGVE